jgi:hypothetical protein
MPVSRYSKMLNVSGKKREQLFSGSGSEEIRRIAKDYLISPERERVERLMEKKARDWEILANQMVGCEQKFHY